MKLNVPSYTQLEPYSCLPACIKVVLQFYGTDISEQEIQRVLTVSNKSANIYSTLLKT